jgi:hypothetical protein
VEAEWKSLVPARDRPFLPPDIVTSLLMYGIHQPSTRVVGRETDQLSKARVFHLLFPFQTISAEADKPAQLLFSRSV